MAEAKEEEADHRKYKGSIPMVGYYRPKRQNNYGNGSKLNKTENVPYAKSKNLSNSTTAIEPTDSEDFFAVPAI